LAIDRVRGTALSLAQFAARFFANAVFGKAINHE
jgi:hypothetical protein